jgi:hypothetical protein
MMSSHPERVYALLVEANPIPNHGLDSERAEAPRSRLTVVPDASSTEPASPPGTASPDRSWLRPAAAAAAVILVALLAALLISRGAGTEFVEPATPEDDALTRVEAWFEAIDQGRVDDLSVIFGTDLSDADRQMWEFNAILADAHPRALQSCVVTESVGTLILLECLVTDTDPVSSATGTAELVYPFRYDDGVLQWQEFRTPTGESSAFLGSAAYAEYLELFFPDEFEQDCSSASATGSVVFNGYLALTPECAELMTTHSGAVATWVEQQQNS